MGIGDLTWTGGPRTMESPSLTLSGRVYAANEGDDILGRLATPGGAC